MKSLQLLLSIIWLLFLFSCEKETSNPELSPKICGVDNPFNQLDWLQQLISSNTSCTVYNGAKLFSYRYSGIEVFYFINPANSKATCTSAVYNCQGNRLEIADWQDFEVNRTNEKLLWEK